MGALFQMGQGDLNANDASPKGYRPGAISMAVDSFGYRIFRYTKIVQAGGQAKGEVSSRAADVTGTVTAAAGELNDTLHLSDTGNFTASAEIGKICHITDNADAAGAAPEGEVASIVANTTGRLEFDHAYPLSTSPGVGDTYQDIAVWLGNDSGASDNAINVLGLVMADRTTQYYGWNQFYGLNPGALFTTAAVVAGVLLITDATPALATVGGGTAEDWVGYCPCGIGANLVTPFRSLAFMDLLCTNQPIA
jgi:hypothetical protein